jgi:hypothetical protein
MKGQVEQIVGVIQTPDIITGFNLQRAMQRPLN